MIGRIRVISTCVLSDCRCDHHGGVVVYDGHLVDEAADWKARSPYREPGYETHVEYVPPEPLPPGRRY